jgi:WD40 repeat protein
LIGTSLPPLSEAIGANNIAHLKRIGQWGRGSILGVGFTPDGGSFIAISELGWSIYNLNELDKPPLWVAFDRPVLFDEFYFSRDGSMIKFIDSGYPADSIYIKSYPYGEAQRKEVVKEWLGPSGEFENNDLTLQSPDATKVFISRLEYGYNEETFSEETTVREMYDANHNLLYTLKDDTPYVTYSDRNGPEGCDLSVFSPCGNALMAVATSPVKALFSADSSTFAALYDPPSLYSGIMRAYSYVRIYDSSTGDLLGSLGGFTKPVQDFDYSRDGKSLVVGFVDGSIVLWDIKSAKSVFGTRHMNAPAWKVMYSQDSKYLLIQRAEELEVRLTTNGALLYRFDAAEFAVSPVRNLVALGDTEGNIQIRDLIPGVRNIQAHDDRIYSVAFSADGLYLASSGQDCDIKLWALDSGKLLHHFEETSVDAYEIGEPSRIFSTYLEFVPNKNMLIGFGSWGTVINWNVNSGATNYVIQSNALEYYNGMITLKPHFPEFFDTDTVNNRFYINDNSFDLNTGESLGVYELPASLPAGCSPAGPRSSDKALMFTRGYETREGKICILDTGTLALLGEIHVMPESDSYIEWVDWLYLSPDGRQLIVTVGSGIVYVYQIVL